MGISLSQMEKYEKQKKAALFALTYIRDGFPTTGNMSIKHAKWAGGSACEGFAKIVDENTTHYTRLFIMNHSHRKYEGEISTVKVDVYHSNHTECRYDIVKDSEVICISIGGKSSEFFPVHCTEEELFQYSTVMDSKVFEYYDIARTIHGHLMNTERFSITETSLTYMAVTNEL